MKRLALILALPVLLLIALAGWFVSRTPAPIPVRPISQAAPAFTQPSIPPVRVPRLVPLPPHRPPLKFKIRRPTNPRVIHRPRPQPLVNLPVQNEPL